MSQTVYVVSIPSDQYDVAVAVFHDESAAETLAAARHGYVTAVPVDPAESDWPGAYGAQVDTLGYERTWREDHVYKGTHFGPWELNDGTRGLPACGHFRAEAYEATPEEAIAAAKRLLESAVIDADALTRRQESQERRRAEGL